MNHDPSVSNSPSTRSDLPDPSSVLENRDVDAFGRLLDRYRPMLRAMAMELHDPRLQPKLDVSDIVQETCQDAIEGFAKLQARDSRPFLQWLRVLLVNNSRAARRRYLKSAKRNVQKERSLHGASGLMPHLLDRRTPGDEELFNHERMQKLTAALSALPPALQTMLKWRYEEGLTLREIGQRVNRSEDSVRMLLKRCLKSLKPIVFESYVESSPADGVTHGR